MMFSFTDRAAFLAQINSWIRDGSNLEMFSASVDSESVTLRGQDGCIEEFFLFYKDEDKAAFDEVHNL